MDKSDKQAFINEYNEVLKASNVDMTLLDITGLPNSNPRLRQGLVWMVSHQEVQQAIFLDRVFLPGTPEDKKALELAKTALLSHLYSQDSKDWYLKPLPSGCLIFQVHRDPPDFCFRFEW